MQSLNFDNIWESLLIILTTVFREGFGDVPTSLRWHSPCGRVRAIVPLSHTQAGLAAALSPPSPRHITRLSWPIGTKQRSAAATTAATAVQVMAATHYTFLESASLAYFVLIAAIGGFWLLNLTVAISAGVYHQALWPNVTTSLPSTAPVRACVRACVCRMAPWSFAMPGGVF